MARRGRRHRERWSRADKARIRDATRRGTPAGIVADRMGRTPGAVYAKAFAMGRSFTSRAGAAL